MRFQPVMCALLVLLGLAGSGPLYADYPIEVIELQSRTLEEVIPVIRPLLGPGESVTGMGNNLVLKAPPGRVGEIRKLLQELDRPPRRLQITVGNQGDVARSSRGYSGSAVIRSGDGQISINSPGTSGESSSARVRLHDRATQRSSTAGYRVQALEGRPAWISSGTRVPVSGVERYYRNGVPYERRTTQLQDVSSGFYVIPRVQGDSVQLEILQHDDRAGGGRGVVSTQGAGTVVRGRLGEWLDLGGIDTRSNTSQGGLGRSITTQDSEIRHISVRVDCLDCGMAESGNSQQSPFRYQQQ